MKLSWPTLFRGPRRRSGTPSQPSRPGRRPPGKKRVRLEVQALEDRLVPTVFFQPRWGTESQIDTVKAIVANAGVGGAVATAGAMTVLTAINPAVNVLPALIDPLADLVHNAVKSPKVQLIFWGWTANAIQSYDLANPDTPLPSYQGFYNAAAGLLGSAFLQGTGQYGTNGHASLNNTFWLDPNPLPSQLNDGNLCSEVDNINHGNSDPQTVYVFVTPPQLNNGSWGAWSNNFGGSTVGYNTFTKSLKPIPVIWAGDTAASSPYSCLDQFTWDFSHELAEMVTSPNTWVTPGGNPNAQLLDPHAADQIGDFEANEYRFRMANGAEVQPYWSQSDQQFVVSDGTGIATYELTPQWSGSTFKGFYTLHVWQDRFANDSYVIGSRGSLGPGGFTMTDDGDTATFDRGYVASSPLGPITVSPAYGSTLTLNLDGNTGFTIDEEADGLWATFTDNQGNPDFFRFDPGRISDLIINGTGAHNWVNITNLQGGITSIQINNQDPTNTFSVENLPAGVSLSVNADGATVTFSPNAKNMSNIQGALSIDSHAVLVFNDRNAAAGTSYDVKPGEIDRNGQAFVVGASRTSIDAVTLNTCKKAPGTVKVELGRLTPTVTLNGAKNAGQALTVVEYTDVQLASTYSISGGQLEDDFTCLGPQQDVIHYTNLGSLSVYPTQSGTVNIEGTPAPTTVSLSVVNSQVNVDAKSMDLSNLGGGQLTVHGGGNTVLNVSDQADSFPSLRYTLSAGELMEEWYGPQGRWSMGWNPLATIDYDNLQNSLSGVVVGLNVHVSNGGNEVDVSGTPGALTVWGGTGSSTVNVCPTTQNLDGLGLLTVYGASKLGIPGSIPVGNTTLNVYDQGNPHYGSGATSYSIGRGQLKRSSAAVVKGKKLTRQTEVDYLDLTGLALYTRQSPNVVSVFQDGAVGRGCPITINSGAADTITATINPVVEFQDHSSQLTVDGHGGTLTLDLTKAAADFDDGENVVLHRTGYTVTDQSVAYSDWWRAVGVVEPDPDNIHQKNKKPVMYDWTGHNAATISYQNLTSLTIDSAPVDTKFDVQSTKSGTPLTINAGTGQRPSTYSDITQMNGGSTVNQFTVGANGSVKGISSHLTLNGGSNVDTLVVDDSKATSQDVVTVTGTQVGAGGQDQFFGKGGFLDYSAIGSLTLNLSQHADDAVILTPSAATAFFLNGDPTEFQAGRGAKLTLNLTGVTGAKKTPKGPGAGTWTFDVDDPVTFTGFAQDGP